MCIKKVFFKLNVPSNIFNGPTVNPQTILHY